MVLCVCVCLCVICVSVYREEALQNTCVQGRFLYVFVICGPWVVGVAFVLVNSVCASRVMRFCVFEEGMGDGRLYMPVGKSTFL